MADVLREPMAASVCGFVGSIVAGRALKNVYL